MLQAAFICLLCMFHLITIWVDDLSFATASSSLRDETAYLGTYEVVKYTLTTLDVGLRALWQWKETCQCDY